MEHMWYDQCDQIWPNFEPTMANNLAECDRNVRMISVTRLGDFRKFSVPKILTKVAETIGNFLGYFVKSHSYVNTTLATF